jgi:hypothetical protein
LFIPGDLAECTNSAGYAVMCIYILQEVGRSIAVRTQACPGIKRYSRKSYDHPVILCKSWRSAKTTMGSILSFIEKMLFLKVNRDKAKVAYIKDIKFLGYSF